MYRRILLLGLLTLLANPVVAADIPAPPDAKERCAVCGMFVAPHSAWIAVAVLPDGQRAYFDGPKDLFRFLASIGHFHPGVTPEQLKGVWVTDYYTAELLPATEVLFVGGSDVLGPMGADLVAVSGADALETFQRDHGGDRLMRFDGRELVVVPK